jgi:hypothetical protein
MKTVLRIVLEENGLTNKPQHVYNLDETGLQPDHRPPNVIASVKTKPQAITSPRSTTTTLIACINALGHSIPPFFIFKGVRFNPELMKGATFGSKGVMSETGWSNGQIFKEYLKDHFLPYARPCALDKQPILLIYDGHASHKNPELIKWAREQGIILFVLPAHTSHVLQPLDVAVFGPFKNYYYTECSAYMCKNIGRTITKYDICGIACRAFLKAMTPANIQAAFRKTGIHPWNSGVVSKEMLFPCEGFREERPAQKILAMTSGKEAVDEFLKLKEEEVGNKSCNCPCKRKVTSHEKPNAGGKEITGNEYFEKIINYHEDQVSRENKKKTTSK